MSLSTCDKFHLNQRKRSHFIEHEMSWNIKTSAPGFHVLMVISDEQTVRMLCFLGGGEV